MADTRSEGQRMAARVGMALLMVTVSLLFGVMSVSYLSGTHGEAAIELPILFWINVLPLAASSFALHMAWMRRGRPASRYWGAAAAVIALLFMVLQAAAWVQMTQAGLTLSGAGRRVSYLYVLSGLHVLHLVAGWIYFMAVLVAPRRVRESAELALFFWHFLGILWVYLLAVMAIAA